MKYYCKCLNICVELDSEDLLPDEPLTVSEEEKKDQFFAQLPLLVVRELKVKKQQPMLVRSKRIGSWEVYKCTNCSTFSHAIENDNSNTKLMNKSLLQLPDSEVQNIKNSVDYSPVFHIVVADTSLFGGDLSETSQLNGNFSNDVVELQKQLSDYVDEKNRITDEKIRTYVEQQQSALKKLLKRANEDFQILTNVIAQTDEPGMKRNNLKEVNSFNNGFEASQTPYTSTPPINISSNSVINNFDNMSISPSRGIKKDIKNTMVSGIPPSFDSEGLFPLDGMEEPNVLEEDEHSEEDLSDTDDSGSRDEGIHIPRRKSFAIAKSLPIRVPGEFDPSFRDFGEVKMDKKKPNYQQKRHKQPLDIAASIKALANSVHGDTMFGDLPPPRIGSRI